MRYIMIIVYEIIETSKELLSTSEKSLESDISSVGEAVKDQNHTSEVQEEARTN